MKNYSSSAPSGSVLMRDVFLNLRRELLKNPHYQLVPSEVRAPSFFFCVCIVSVKRRFFLENNRRYFFILLLRVFFIGNLPGWGSKSAVYFRSCFVSKIGKFCKTRNDDGRIRHGNQLKRLWPKTDWTRHCNIIIAEWAIFIEISDFERWQRM